MSPLVSQKHLDQRATVITALWSCSFPSQMPAHRAGALNHAGSRRIGRRRHIVAAAACETNLTIVGYPVAFAHAETGSVRASHALAEVKSVQSHLTSIRISLPFDGTRKGSSGWGIGKYSPLNRAWSGRSIS